MIKDEKTIEELEKQLAEMPGHKVDLVLRRLHAFSLQLFDRNYFELHQVLKAMTQEGSGVGDLFGRVSTWKLDVILNEVGFLLHNYVASAFSLVEHSRIIYKDCYKSKRLFEEYKAEVDAKLKKSEIIQFVQILHQMFQHYRLPMVSARHVRPSGKITLYLNKNTLLRFDRWNAPAKSFFSEKEEVDLLDVVERYHEQIHAFHGWVRQQLLEIYKDEFDAIERIHDQIREREKDELVNELEMALNKPVDQRITALRFTLAGLISLANQQRLAQYESRPSVWVREAVRILEQHVLLPSQLLERIFASC